MHRLTVSKTGNRSALVLVLLALACSSDKRSFGDGNGQAAGEAGNGEKPNGSNTGGGVANGEGGVANSEGGVASSEGGVASGEGGDPGNVATCTVQERRCAPTTGVPQLCDEDGVWQDEAACQFACVDGFCGGECKPESGRCDTKTGVPQLCSGTGEWENQAACDEQRTCSAGDCLCTGGFATCGDACVTLSSDPDHCGSCGHSCQGGVCSNSKCQPLELAAGLTQARSLAVDATHVYWMDYNEGVGNVKRVPKAGGATQTLATNQGTPGGLVLADGQLFWGAGTANSKGAVASKAIQRSNPDGTSRVAFAPITNTVDQVALSGNSIYWNERSTGVAFFRKAIAANGDGVPAGTHTNNSNIFTVVGDCVYFRTFVNSVYALAQSCAGATAINRFSSTTNILPSSHDAADATMLYFAVEEQGLLRLPLTGTAQATKVITGIETRGPVVDGNSLYYVDGDTGGAPACTTNWGIYQTGKQPGSPRVTLLPPPLECPGSLATDADAIYWIYQTTGTIMKMAK